MSTSAESAPLPLQSIAVESGQPAASAVSGAQMMVTVVAEKRESSPSLTALLTAQSSAPAPVSKSRTHGVLVPLQQSRPALQRPFSLASRHATLPPLEHSSDSKQKTASDLHVSSAELLTATVPHLAHLSALELSQIAQWQPSGSSLSSEHYMQQLQVQQSLELFRLSEAKMANEAKTQTQQAKVDTTERRVSVSDLNDSELAASACATYSIRCLGFLLDQDDTSHSRKYADSR